MKCNLVPFLVFLVGSELTTAHETLLKRNETKELHPLTAEEHKLLLECEHPDYRSYIKCLKRQKRHHENMGSGRNCLEECYRANCTTSKCLHECYTGCKRKITETYQRVTETEINCDGHNCNDGHGVPNVTTNIHIKNSLFGNDSLFSNISDWLRPKIEIHTVINNDNDKDKGRDCRCPNCNCDSPYFWGPQLTIGLSSGSGGGPCMFPMSWPCFQYPPMHSGIDCSQCANPFLRYRCDVSCYTYSPGAPYNFSNSNPNESATITIDKSKCKSPHCIGGS